MMKNSQQEISTICDEIKNMLLDKNMKYGDSALNPVRVMSKSDSVEQIKVRIDDKLSRLSSGALNDDEDVINDLIGYFILLKIAKGRAKPDLDFSNWSYPSKFYSDPLGSTYSSLDMSIPFSYNNNSQTTLG